VQVPLVGRQAELDTIRGALADGASGGVVITGAAGVGKTRLATEASALADARGAAVTWIRATRAARSVPLGAFAALIPLSPAAPGVELLALARRSLRTRAAGRRLVLCVDDGHLLDDASAALVHQLAAAREAFVVVTLRREAGAPRRPRRAVEGRAVRAHRVRELGRDEVERLLDAMLGGPVERRSANALWELTRGNAQFLRELVRYGRDHGLLERADGIWRWSGATIARGTRIADLVDLRLGDLDLAQRRVLELVAAGAPLELEVLDDDERLAIEALEALELVELRRHGRRRRPARRAPAARGGRLRRHPRRALAGPAQRLADAVEGCRGRRRTDLPRLAAFRLEAGDRRDPALFERRRTCSLAAYDPGRRALRAGGDEAGGGFSARLALGARSRGRRGRQEAEES
jgi:hypothetical protein